MCNEYQLRVRRGDFDWQFSELNVPIRWADAEPILLLIVAALAQHILF